MDPTLADRARAKERGYVPPLVNGDFYRITDLLDQKERAVVKRVRDFMEAAAAPIIDSKSGPALDALISGALTAMRSSIMGTAFPVAASRGARIRASLK